MKKLFYIGSLFLITFFKGYSQNMERVRQYIDTLCAPNYFGRGASYDGQKKAANYLSRQFNTIGLKTIGQTYFQTFNYSTNTFPDNISLRTDKTALVPGKDFIVQAGSASVKGEYKAIYIDSSFVYSTKKRRKFLKVDVSKSVIIYDEQFSKGLKNTPEEIINKINEATGIIELKEKKLTMGISTTQLNKPVFEVLKEKYNIKTKNIYVEVDALHIQNYEAQNICGFVPGAIRPDSFIFITAHYDHLGTLGKNVYFPGANDNASGVSMLLELARFYKENPPKYSVVFIAFGAEEAGLIGSKYFTENPLVPLKDIRFLINLDLMGTGDNGMTVVNGTIFQKEFEMLNSINQQKNLLPEIKKRGKAANSDHYYFSEKGVPSFFFYTLGGIAAYHDVYDIPQTLPLTKYKEVFKLITEFITQLNLN